MRTDVHALILHLEWSLPEADKSGARLAVPGQAVGSSGACLDVRRTPRLGCGLSRAHSKPEVLVSHGVRG